MLQNSRARTRFCNSWSIPQGQRSNQDHNIRCTSTPLTNSPTKYQLLQTTPYDLRDIARTRFNKSRSPRQGQRSNQGHTIAHLQPITNALSSINFLHLTVFRNIGQKRFCRSGSLWQGQRSNQGHTIMLHTYTYNQCPYQVSNSYTLWFLRYSLDKLFPTASPPIWTPWVKTIP